MSERWSSAAVELDVPTRSGARAGRWVAAGLVSFVLAGIGAMLLQVVPLPRATPLTVEQASACLLTDGWPGRRCADVRSGLDRVMPDLDAFVAWRARIAREEREAARELAARKSPPLVIIGRREGTPVQPAPPIPPPPDVEAERLASLEAWTWMQREPGVLAANVGVLDQEARAENALRARLRNGATWSCTALAAIGVLLAAWAWRRPRTTRVQLGVDGVTVGSVHVARAGVDTLVVHGDRLVITSGGRTIRSPRLHDPSALRAAVGAWRRLAPAPTGGVADPALDRLRRAGTT